ncbi:branched-chain amino acid ABC transporter permease [Kyrpidia tusciae]|uniref:Inner-membrane translocator n=1 Tax=Kyrpidia tusciae (strain DSM 2912 / NBRC 15312 / T2) TaxID=562970 RepID=D5WY36_KYRT2|nr:branched-chain amino acid ABC transporter permease [Kyrpidia tusciae]ADG06095.1 inner-membrane translocator [Kyrpidia tusciae DSM 2912]
MKAIKRGFPRAWYNPWIQALLLAAYTAGVSAALAFSGQSVIWFLLLVASLLFLYHSSLPRKVQWIWAAVVLGAILPLAASTGPAYESYMEVATQMGIYIAMAVGLNIVVGFAGLLDLGFVAFFSLGAYTYAIFFSDQANQFLSGHHFPLPGGLFWLFLPLGMFIAGLFGVLLGLPVLRVKGDYLAIVTLGFGEIIRIIFNNLDKPVNITNGAIGISSVRPPELFGVTFTFPHHYYYLVLVLLAGVFYAVHRLEHSRIGRAWKAVREDEIAAQAMGVPLVRTKLTAFAAGASFSGLMGVVFAAKQAFIDPTSFTMLESITILVMVILGGMGSLPGAVVGACLVTVLNLQLLPQLTNWLNQLAAQGMISFPPALSPSKMQRFLFGMLLILFTVFRPKGVLPARLRRHDPGHMAELAREYRQGIAGVHPSISPLAEPGSSSSRAEKGMQKEGMSP